jgi:hypothetical protein
MARRVSTNVVLPLESIGSFRGDLNARGAELFAEQYLRRVFSDAANRFVRPRQHNQTDEARPRPLGLRVVELNPYPLLTADKAQLLEDLVQACFDTFMIRR